jgi:hypothetical protein
MKMDKTIDGVNDRKEQLIAALRKKMGIVTAACEDIGIDRTTYYNYYNTDTEFKRAVDEIQDRNIDFVESKLYTAINDGDMTGIIFYLKCKAKNRGYIDRTYLTHEHAIYEELPDADLNARIESQQNRISALIE